METLQNHQQSNITAELNLELPWSAGTLVNFNNNNMYNLLLQT